jgi:two-component system phosphate regulon sensor histidine kinase PhoR
MSDIAGDLAAILVERSPHGILVTGPDGRIRQTNPALRHMVPMVPGPLGRTVLEAVPVPALAEAFSPGRDDEVELSFRLGARELLVQVVPLGPEAGRLAMVQDITRLRRAERYRAEFVGNVSHELRTPATAISGYAETLLEERDSLDPLHAEMVEVIHRNARRLTALFDDLLTLSRLDAREGPLPLSSFRLGPVVAEAFDKCATLARDKRIHFESLVPPALEVLANRDAMGHVVGNLVENAVKYSYEGGAVTVRAQPRDRYVLL